MRGALESRNIRRDWVWKNYSAKRTQDV